jgi:CRISPR/Cas system-associated protein Cas10 (large subunit of type III CRISPR-Cas system)
MDALATQRRNDQYFPEEENDDVRRWIDGEDVFESVKKRLNERKYSSDMIVWEMCPYCEEEVEVYGSDREPCCPRCGAHFSLSDEAIEMSITEPYDKGYVVIDGTGAVRGQFERGDYESAIEYANELAIESGLKASFDVYGVERDGYSTDDYDSTIIYSTYDNENELRNMMFNK